MRIEILHPHINNPFREKRKWERERIRLQVVYQFNTRDTPFETFGCSPQCTASGMQIILINTKWMQMWIYVLKSSNSKTNLQWSEYHSNKLSAYIYMVLLFHMSGFGVFVDRTHNDYCNWMLFFCIFSLWPLVCDCLYCIVSIAIRAKWLNCPYILCNCIAMPFT